MIDDHVVPAAPADPLIDVVAADDHLIAVHAYIALFIEAGVDGRLGPAAADALDLGDGVSQFEQPPAAREQMGLEIGP